MTRTAQQVVSAARGLIGKAGWSGWCEKLVRTAFGFPARYASAKLAYDASKRDGKIHTDTNPPAGVPVFWDITSGVNAKYDHVAVSIGGGKVISTSVGPGKTPAVIGINELTRRWGMRYLGWGDHYHGQRVHTPSKPKPPAGADNDTLRFQQRANTYLRAGLLEDGINGAVTKGWRTWTGQLQTALNHFKSSKKKLVVDRDPGPVTAAYVGDVQQRNGLVVDRYPGPVMVRWMRSKGSSIPNRPANRP